MKISLIISTYRNSEFLNLVLESVQRQTRMPDEVIIAEDGEYLENQWLVRDWKPRLKAPLFHVKQEDRGNRKPLIQNKAVAASTGDYLVFVDADCVLRSDFIKAHEEFAEDGAFLTGRRVELSQKATALLTPKKITEGYLDGMPWQLLGDSIFGETRPFWRFFRTPGAFRGLLGQDKVTDIRGCNFSVHRAPLLQINGFGNEFSGAYGEDSDVEYRLKFLGLRMKSVKGAALQYHLFHRQQAKDVKNQERLKAVLDRGEYRTPNGLSEAQKES